METFSNSISGKKEDFTDPVIFSQLISGDETAWKNFIGQYNPLIDRQINRTFHLDYYTFDDNDFDEVKNSVIDMLLDNQSLSKIDDPAKLGQWLSRVSRNKTHDYVRYRKKAASSFEEEVRRSTLSLQDSFDNDNDFTLGDMIPDRESSASAQESDISANIRNVINSIEWIYRIILKLYLIFCDDILLLEDINRIASDRGVDADTVKKDISNMLGSLADKNEKAVLREGETMVVSAYLDRLKTRHEFLLQYSDQYGQEISEVEKTITRKKRRLKELLSENQKPIVPSNREMGTVLGLKNNTVNTRLFRARKILKKYSEY